MAVREVPFTELLSHIVDNRGRTCPISDSGMPLIATNCVRNDLLYPAYDKVRLVSKDTYANWFRGHPEPGDLIFVCKGSPGRVCLTPDPVGFCIAQDMVAVRADPTKVYPRFLFAALRSDLVQQRIGNMHVGTLIPHFKKGDFDKLLVPLPDYGTQTGIGDLYFTLSAKIELNRRMNATLEGISRAIFKSWFVDFDPVRQKAAGKQPVGMDAQTAALFPDSFEESEIGEVPTGWPASVVGNLYDIAMGQSPPGGTYNESGDGLPFFQGRADFSFRYPERRVFCTAPTRFASPGDTLVSVRAPVGDLNMALERCAIGRGVAAVRHKEGATGFTYYAMHALSSSFETFEGEGTVFGSMGKKEFHGLKAVAPSQDVIRAFERVVGPLDKQIEILERQTATLAALRDTLLPKLLSGAVRVPEAEEALQGVWDNHAEGKLVRK
jgi:type I restriction enzyme, S subunit